MVTDVRVGKLFKVFNSFFKMFAFCDIDLF